MKKPVWAGYFRLAHMTPAQLRSALHRLNVRHSAFGRAVGTYSQVKRWLSGKTKIPKYVQVVLKCWRESKVPEEYRPRPRGRPKKTKDH